MRPDPAGGGPDGGCRKKVQVLGITASKGVFRSQSSVNARSCIRDPLSGIARWMKSARQRSAHPCSRPAASCCATRRAGRDRAAAQEQGLGAAEGQAESRRGRARRRAARSPTEETGHDVAVHEYLGEMASEPGAKPKTVQFWRMHADGKPTRKLMRDVRRGEVAAARSGDRDALPCARARVSPPGRPGRAAVCQAARSAYRRQHRTAPESARIRAWLRRLTRCRLPAL